jgi:hypothetical protein
MTYVIIFLRTGFMGLFVFHEFKLRKRAEKLSSKVDRTLKNESTKPIDFFTSAEARKQLGAKGAVERLADQIQRLKKKHGATSLHLDWDGRSLSEKLTMLEKDFEQLTLQKMKEKWNT